MLEQEEQRQQDQVDGLHRLYIEAGGGNIELLEQRIADQERSVRLCEDMVADYQRLIAGQDLDPELNAAALRRNQERARQMRAEQQPVLEQLEHRRDEQSGAALNARNAVRDLEQELEQAKEHAHSNLPGNYLGFKQDLAAALGVPIDVLAYVAELVEVKPEEQAWRGAIERALGGQRLRLIVPGEQVSKALAWVNQRHNRLHARLLDAGRYRGQPARFLADGFTHKLNFTAHPLREALKSFLAEHDLHCVADTDQLHHTPHALTVQGTISGKRGRFDKQDQRALDQGWMTGFDNRDRVRQEVETATTGLAGAENKLVRLMNQAQREDTGALAEVGTEIRDIPNYLQRLEVLTKEALPEKLERFLSYLNKSSDEGVTQLLAHIDNEVSIIEERIAELNETLIQVDFQPGRYLHLEPRKVIHQALTDVHRAQKALRSAALRDDQGESHYRALVELVGLLRDAVERRKTTGAQALLDPRYRLQFFVKIIQRDGQHVIETRTGSQGGSGGEKEIIASYILTASLSYALCPDDLGRPLFGTVVLDEAFSKSSQAVAARIIEALRQFGLHPLFITPNKEMRLLRVHTRSAVLVHRRGQQAVTASLSWEELDQQARQRISGTA